VSALAYPAQLRDLPSLRSLTGTIDRTASGIQQLGRDATGQQGALRAAWSSPPANACTGHLGHLGRTLASSGGALEQLAPEVRSYCQVLESGEAAYRQLVRELRSIPSTAEPDLVAQIERSVRSRYDQLVQALVAAERRVVETSSRIDERLVSLLEMVGDGLEHTWLGAVLAGASTARWRDRKLFDGLRWVEGRYGARLPGAVNRYATLGHDLFDRLRVPTVAGRGNTPLSDLYGRYTSAGRSPVLQFLFHDRIRAAQEAMSPAALRRLGAVGRWGRPIGGGLGAVVTVAMIPSDYAANRDSYLAEGRSSASARALAAEDVAFRTGGEVVGGLAGAKGGAVVGAAIGSIFPGVGTVIGAGVGAIAGGIAGAIAGGHIGEAAKDAFRSGRQAVGNAARSVGSAVGTAGRAVGDAVSNAGHAVGDAASSVASGAKNVIGGLVRSIF
jgi:hypothetical protein